MRVAVIGSGVAGLAATWAINEYSSYNGDESELEEGENKRNEKHQVNLYEAAEYVGGHTHTVEFESGFADFWFGFWFGFVWGLSAAFSLGGFSISFIWGWRLAVLSFSSFFSFSFFSFLFFVLIGRSR